MKKEELEQRIEELQYQIDNFDKSEFADEQGYDDWLDEISGEVTIGSLSYSASRVLSQVDPIAYRCGFSDYVDGLDNEDFEEYTALVDELEELELELEELEESEGL